MRISDWSSDVCSSDLAGITRGGDDVHAYLHVVQKEIRRPCHIGLYPADQSGAMDDHVRGDAHQIGTHGHRVAQVKLAAVGCVNFPCVSSWMAQQALANHPASACNEQPL